MLNPQHVSHQPKGPPKTRQMNCVISVAENIMKEKELWFEGQNWTIDQVERVIGSIKKDPDVYHGLTNRKK